MEKDLQELKTFVDQAQRPRIKDLLSLQVRKIETDVGALKEQLAPAGAATTKPAAAAAVPAASKSRYEVELSQYAFDQSDKFVKLFVTLAGVEKSPEDNVVVDFTPNSLVLTVKDLNNRDHKLQINNLLEPIDVAKSYRKLKTGMVVIYAKKVTEGKQLKYAHIKLAIIIYCFLFSRFQVVRFNADRETPEGHQKG